MLIRNKTIPLYLWIQDKGTILNLNEESVYSFKLPIRIEVAMNVMNRYLRIYKTNVTRGAELFERFSGRYRFSSKYMFYDFMPSKNQHIGLLFCDEYEIKALKAPLAAQYRNEKLDYRQNLKRKKPLTGIELDLFTLTQELQGVINHEIRLRR